MLDYPSYKVAVTQISPVWYDLEASTNKACQYIKEAASNGARLIAFPEGFLPGYPLWTLFGDPLAFAAKFWDRFYRNAVEIPSKTVSQLSAAAKDNKIFVCISCTEKDGASLYLTQLWFNDKGDLIGKHRKMRPTLTERIIWGEGDGSMTNVYETDIGRVGSLQCWEHMMPGNLLAMASQNEQVHVAAWPFGMPMENHLLNDEALTVASQYYAAATGTFVLSSTCVINQDIFDKLGANYLPVGMGHAMVVNPNGYIVSERMAPDQEGIVYADIDLDDIIASKYLIDIAGHYSKPNVCRVIFNKNPQQMVTTVGEAPDYFISADDLQEVPKS